MRKSSLILLLVMAFVLTSVAAGFCVVNEVGEPCKICTDKHGWKYGLQIELKDCEVTQTVSSCPCPLFDYEMGTGYCPTQDVQGILFKLCDCEDYNDTDFTATGSYAIRLTIMEPASGVYWTNANPAKTACAYTAAPSPQTCVPDANTSIRVTSFPDPDLTPSMTHGYCVDPCDASVYALSRHDIGYSSATVGQTLYDALGTPADTCCFTCGTERVMSIKTCYAPIMGSGEPLLLIDIPTMVYDPNDINVVLGTAVKVKVEILTLPEDGDVCVGGCKVLCDCIVKVGEFSNCSPQGCSLCLPYLAVDSDWWTGLALTNPTKSIDTVEITIYADGQSETATVTVDAKSVKTINIGDLLADMSLPEAPMYASIISDGSIEGFVMVGTGMDAVQGYVAPMGPCGCGSQYAVKTVTVPAP